MVHQKILSGKIYPDRSFSLGFCRETKKLKAEREYDRNYVSQPETDYGAVADYLTSVNSIEGKFCSTSEAPLLVKGAKSSQKSRGSYGKHGITSFGRRFVKNSCILLERKFGKRLLGFGTATIPGMDRETCEAVNGAISDITRRFYQKIKRLYAKRNSEFIYVGCIEIQEKRFGDSGLPVPHLHFVFLARHSIRSGYTCTTSDFYKAWNESVNQCLVKLGKKEIMGVNGHIGSVKLEPIRSSAAAYIGKYLSKGAKVVASMQEKGFKKFPKQWWTASMQMKKMFRESIIHIDKHLGLSFFYQLEYYLHEGIITWARFVDVLIGGEYRTVGLVGKLSPEAYASLSTG